MEIILQKFKIFLSILTTGKSWDLMKKLKRNYGYSLILSKTLRIWVV